MRSSPERGSPPEMSNLSMEIRELVISEARAMMRRR
jgi:hypothetical protein